MPRAGGRIERVEEDSLRVELEAARAMLDYWHRQRDALALLVAEAGFAWSATDSRVKMTTGERLALVLTACEEASKGWRQAHRARR